MRRDGLLIEPEPMSGSPETEPPSAHGRRLRLLPLIAIVVILIGASWPVITARSGSAPKATIVGGNLPVNAGAPDLADISAHNSPTLARNPIDGGNLAIANRIDLPAFSCALHLSFDGGASWSQTPLPVPPGEEPKCFAPDVAFDAEGTLFLVFQTLKGTGNLPNALWLSTSRDGGRTLTTPTPVLGPLAFQVRLTADPSVPGRLYLTWLQVQATATLAFPEDGNPILARRSDNGGATWSDPIRVNDPSRQRVLAPSMAVGIGGQLHVLYLDIGEDRLDYSGAHEGKIGPPFDGTWSLVTARSSDHGRTWTETVVEEGLVPTERFVVFLPPAPSLTVDRERDRVYVAYNDGRAGDADVRVWSSRDGGRTWGGPVRVNDTPTGDGTSQYRPKVSVAPNGRVDILYYDRRADAADVMNEVSLQSSFDGGRSFTPSLRVSDKPFDSRLGFGADRGMADLGSRLGLLSTEYFALGVWSDTRLGTEASNKQDLVMGLVQLEAPQRQPAALPAIRRFGGVASVVGGVLLLLWSLRRTQPALPPTAAGAHLVEPRSPPRGVAHGRESGVRSGSTEAPP